MTELELSQLVEGSEADAYVAIVDVAADEWRERHGVKIEPVGGGLALVSKVERSALVFNRVIGLGWHAPVDAGLLADLDRIYRANGVMNYAVEIAPTCVFGDPAADMRAASYLRFGSTMLMGREVAPLDPVECDFTVRAAGAADAAAFAALCCQIFRMSEPYGELVASGLRIGRGRYWMAFDGEQPVGMSMTLSNRDGIDWYGWVGTLPTHRGRGVQTALTAAQLDDSARRGARWVTLEVAAGARGEATPSFRNYSRLGWRAAHERTTYLRRLRA